MSATETIAEQSNVDVEELCREMAANARTASQGLPLVGTQTKNDYLNRAADDIEANADKIIAANDQDIANAPRYGLTPAAVDRLRLNKERIKAIADGIRVVAALPDPVGETIDSFRRPNGLAITQVRVPLGVVFFIYESRPNVPADAAAICLKSGNAVILRGGKEALHSSREIVSIMQRTLDEFGLDPHAIQLVPITDRATVGHFLKMADSIDVAIPRGGKELIQRVADEATMPVIKHFDGICHVYVDPTADVEMALNIIENSKCHRMGVCNAMECLIVHRDIAATFLPAVQKRLASYSITYHADPSAIKFLSGAKPATATNWSTEYLGPEMSVRVVKDLQEAITHISTYGSGHTDTIVSNDYESVETFLNAVDSSAVMVNASTRFNDGGEFGFGAEIGISTDKFHARGPCGLRELTSYKYIVRGNGQIRK